MSKKQKHGAETWITGTLQKHRRGFGFVKPEAANDLEAEGDIFIGARNMGQAMHGDLVAVSLLPSWQWEQSREGVIEKVLRHAVQFVVGDLEIRGKYGFVTPDDRKINDDIFIEQKYFSGARDGDKVLVQILRWPSKGRNAEGKVTEIVGRKGEQGLDILSMIIQSGIPREFPRKATEEAEAIEPVVQPEDLQGREDLRNQVIVTIDGADAKDLDDAVSVTRLENGNYVLGVHIADVSHYIKEDGPLDREAMKRGCSVYLIDQVVPMLPHQLSNGICSLNPQVDRLTLSIEMELDSTGDVVSHRIFESVIRTVHRLIYSEISDLLEHQDAFLAEKFRDILPDLTRMEELARILRHKRDARGSLDFDFDEAYITLNEQGIPLAVETSDRRIANRIIEEFMLVANETIAEHYFWMELPFVYRIHEKPSLEKMEEFKRFVAGFGYRLKGNPEFIHPRALNEILTQVAGKPEEHVVSTIMLRSMKKAFYGIECQGHFGLGVKYYCHFTSPIRRYPDLMIHRIIKESLRGELTEKRKKWLHNRAFEASELASATERRAEELEREVEKLKKAEYMSYHLEEEFDGVVSGVTSFGFFVELENTIEGMVRLDSMEDDFYDYEEGQYRLMGRRTKKIIGLGQKVRIQVSSVDLDNREINFLLVGVPQSRTEQDDHGI